MESKHGSTSRGEMSPDKSAKASKDDQDEDKDRVLCHKSQDETDRTYSRTGSSYTLLSSASRSSSRLNTGASSPKPSSPQTLSPRVEYPAEAKESGRGRLLEDESCGSIREEKADSEFEELLRMPDKNSGGEIVISTDPLAISILDGFKM